MGCIPRSPHIWAQATLNPQHRRSILDSRLTTNIARLFGRPQSCPPTCSFTIWLCALLGLYFVLQDTVKQLLLNTMSIYVRDAENHCVKPFRILTAQLNTTNWQKNLYGHGERGHGGCATIVQYLPIISFTCRRPKEYMKVTACNWQKQISLWKITTSKDFAKYNHHVWQKAVREHNLHTILYLQHILCLASCSTMTVYFPGTKYYWFAAETEKNILTTDHLLHNTVAPVYTCICAVQNYNRLIWMKDDYPPPPIIK